MKHKQDTRRTLARGRRKEDVKKYEKLLDSKVPQTLGGITYENQPEWKRLVEGKLKVAKNDVEALDKTFGSVKHLLANETS